LKYKAKLRARVEADAAIKVQTVETKQVVKIDVASSEFVKETLETAVSESWTKTKTVAELRKSEGMTIKKARELVKEAFEAKSKPIAIKA
jgi:hypothetical protein